MAKDESQKVLETAILKDGRKKAEKTLADAKAQAEKILSDARSVAEAESDKIRAAGKRNADNRSEMVLRTVDQEVARRELRAREGIVQEAFDLAEAKVADLSGEEYTAAVVQLALMAVRGMETPGVVLRIGRPASGDIDAAKVAAKVAEKLKAEGRDVTVRGELADGLRRGVVVVAEDGSMQWDNTFHARLRRLRADLRRLIVPVLFEET